jgi:hypothetical protein
MKEETPKQDSQAIIAEIIRSASSEVRLVNRNEIETEFLKADHSPHPEFETAFAAAMASQQDLSFVKSPEGMELYHSLNHMSCTYACILARKKSPVIQMAETVRENSRLYPRPIPLDIFIEPPFDLQPEEIEASLTSMNDNPDFNDIAHTTTTVGTVYLYSTRHLEHDYAQFLAERQDVGLAANP